MNNSTVPGTGPGVHGRAGAVGGSETVSTNVATVAIPAMPSATAWCILTNSPMRLSASPGRKHICHSGLDRFNRCRRMRSTACSRAASPAGAGSGTTHTC
jgi:hypothetical protein